MPPSVKWSRLLWLIESTECGRSDTMWFPRLHPKRRCRFCLICWNILSLRLQSLCKQSDHSEATLLWGSPSRQTTRRVPELQEERDAWPAPIWPHPHEKHQPTSRNPDPQNWKCEVVKGLFIVWASPFGDDFLQSNNGNGSLIPLVFREMQIKPEMKKKWYHYTPTRMTKMDKSDNSKCRRGHRSIGTFVHFHTLLEEM